jgi:hypothetical protein
VIEKDTQTHDILCNRQRINDIYLHFAFYHVAAAPSHLKLYLVETLRDPEAPGNRRHFPIICSVNR